MPLDSSINLRKQLEVNNFLNPPSDTGQEALFAYESLHSLVRFAVGPYFDLYTKRETDPNLRRGKGSDDAKNGIAFSNLPDSSRNFFSEAENRRPGSLSQTPSAKR
jgi:hypothetical protein